MAEEAEAEAKPLRHLHGANLSGMQRCASERGAAIADNHLRKIRQETTRPKKKSYPKIGPAKNPKKDQIRTGPGGAKFPDLAAVKIWSLFN